MERRKPPAGAPDADADAAPGEPGSDERQGRNRRRFGEGETVVMRLDELLRSRPSPGGPAPGRSNSGEKTQVVSLADLQLSLANQTERTIRSGQLSESQVALLQRTEPRASSEHSRSGPGPSRQAPPPPPPPAPTASGAGVSVWGALPAQDDAPPGVATRIGPIPAREPRPPRAPSAASELATTPGTTAPPERVRPPAAPPTPPPPPPPAPQAGGGWGDAPAREPSRPRIVPAALPPPPPPPPPPSSRGSAREAVTDPGSVSPLLARVAAPTPAAAAAELARQPAATAAAGAKRRVSNQVVVVFSCKGGSGATALAANVAHAAARGQQSACVLDVDLQLGDALAAFGLTPRFSVAQAIHLMQENQQLTRSLLPSHASGVHVLSQVGNLNDLEKITPETMSSLLLALRQHFETLVIDGVRDFGDNVLAMLDGADKVAIVCVQEVLAIRRARWAFGILRKIGFDAVDLTLVVNRYSQDNEIPLESISSMFEGAQVVPLPAEAALVTQSLNRGVPLAELREDSPLVANLEHLCGHLFFNDAVEAAGSDAADGSGGGQRSFLKRIFRGGGSNNGKGTRQTP